MVVNPWHGCKKYSSGCKNCYVYRRDDRIGKDASQVYKTKSFGMLLAKNRKGEYKISAGDMIYLSMTSDFFIDEADEWRSDLWEMIKIRSDLKIMIITKRIERFMECIPSDWGDGYDNVAIACTAENQDVADIRLPIFMSVPIKHKYIVCEPLLSKIDMTKYLDKTILGVVVGGESGYEARVCDYEWILDIRCQCIKKDIPFHFKQTGYRFKKDNKLYLVKRSEQHKQARIAGINYKYDRLL